MELPQNEVRAGTIGYSRTHDKIEIPMHTNKETEILLLIVCLCVSNSVYGPVAGNLKDEPISH